MRRILLILFLVFSCASVSKLTKITFFDISEKDEYIIGKATAGKILSGYKILENDSITYYLNLVGNYLALHSKRPYLYKGYHFGVIDSDEPIAFSTPGFVFLSKKLLLGLDNEDQLAALLSHEIGHIVKKHSLSYIKTAYITDIVSQKIEESASEKLREKNKKMLASISADIASVILKKGYSRKQEEEADFEGVNILKKAGYNPYSLLDVLDEMKKLEKKKKLQILRTHPYPEKRIEKLKNILINKEISESRTKRFKHYISMIR